jgi:hypothetical protein
MVMDWLHRSHDQEDPSFMHFAREILFRIAKHEEPQKPLVEFFQPLSTFTLDRHCKLLIKH